MPFSSDHNHLQFYFNPIDLKCLFMIRLFRRYLKHLQYLLTIAIATIRGLQGCQNDDEWDKAKVWDWQKISGCFYLSTAFLFIVRSQWDKIPMTKINGRVLEHYLWGLEHDSIFVKHFLFFLYCWDQIGSTPIVSSVSHCDNPVCSPRRFLWLLTKNPGPAKSDIYSRAAVIFSYV